MPDIPFFEPVYPLFDLGEFTFSESKGEYLLFIGRICPEKGVHIAIKVAQALNKKLIIAGGVNESNQEYFQSKIKPQLSKKIIYLGEVGFDQKIKLFNKASATLLPISWDEPFGIVMVESMACGTPVVAFDRAAVREIIKDGESGCIIEDGDIEAMKNAVRKAPSLSRQKTRKWVENNFSIENEADKFIKICQKLIKKKN
jgi:glycosyltransferase involved in cell wall biosynthesis